MKVYIAGPITTVRDNNVAAFTKAQGTLARRGHTGVTPFEASAGAWWRRHRRAFDPFTDRVEYGDSLMREITAANLAELTTCDAIALLPGWQDSAGTLPELHLALVLGLAVLDAMTGEPIPGAPLVVRAARTLALAA